MSNEQNTTPVKPAMDAGAAESGANTPDTPAEAGAAIPVKKDDFISTPNASNDSSAEDAARAKERDTRKDGIVKDVFNKYVETDENGNTSFAKVPNDMQWAVEEIKDRYFKQEATPAPSSPTDIDALLNKKIAEKTFETEVERIINDQSYSDTQRADIRDEYTKLQKAGVPGSEALRIAETLVKATSKKVVGTMPNPGKAPDITQATYTAEEYSNLPQKEFEAVLSKVKAGEVRIAG